MIMQEQIIKFRNLWIDLDRIVAIPDGCDFMCFSEGVWFAIVTDCAKSHGSPASNSIEFIEEMKPEESTGRLRGCLLVDGTRKDWSDIQIEERSKICAFDRINKDREFLLQAWKTWKNQKLIQ